MTMYLKLSLRNARRSGKDYSIYIVTLAILTGIMVLSNLVSAMGNRQAGFETSALPLLITIIVVVLLTYINRFILNQRAKEFATYLLMGMEKNKLSWMFFLEFFCLGIFCFIIGIFLGVFAGGTLSFLFSDLLGTEMITVSFILQAVKDTAIYFLVIEILSLIGTKRIIQRLTVRELMTAKKKNQTFSTRSGKGWLICAVTSFGLFLLLMTGIVFLPEEIGFSLVSIISIPLILLIISFYKAVFAMGSTWRKSRNAALFEKNRLYFAGQIFSNARENAMMNSVLSLCLIFSAMAFIFGGTMLSPEIKIMEQWGQIWMGFLQICICIIFMVIYFSVLSIRQLVDFEREKPGIQIFRYLGKTNQQIQGFIFVQICMKFALPMVLCLLLLIIAVPLINYKLDTLLYTSFLIVKIGMGFLFCFITLCIIYFFVIIQMSRKKV